MRAIYSSSLRAQRSKLLFSSLTLLLLIVSSCGEHRPLVDPVNTHYVRVYIHEDIKNVTGQFYDDKYKKPEYKTPTVMRMALCDPSTGLTKFDRYLTHSGKDAKGSYLEGYIACDAGKYQMMVYNWDTEITMIQEPNNYFEALAYTGQAPTKIDLIYNAPDYLFVSRDLLTIHNNQVVDTLFNSNGGFFRADSIVETYFIQVPIRGMQNVKEITAVVTGMSGSEKLSNGEYSLSPVSLMTSMSKGNIVADVTNVYATINTFGHFPGADSEVHLIFYMDMIDGKTYSLDIDITEKYQEEDAIERNWIIIDTPYDAPEVEFKGGGFNPSITQWQDVSADIPL